MSSRWENRQGKLLTYVVQPVGKDRTAIAAMLILEVRAIYFGTGLFICLRTFSRTQLAAVSDEEIMRDYALTRVGAEPMREATVARFAELLQDPDIAESTANALGCRSDSDPNTTSLC